MKRPALIGLSLALIVAGVLAWLQLRTPSTRPDNQQSQTEPGAVAFDTPKKGAHFESSTPAHEQILAGVPVDIVINFNFDLADNSTIDVKQNGQSFAVAQTQIDGNKLSMRRQMAADAPDGIYTVEYQGCWPDRTCHDGHFQFAIDRTQASAYQDLRNQAEVTIKMSQLKFQPMNIKISPSTKVTWINDDEVEHYVNTDSHPAHSQVPGLNSRALTTGGTFNFVFIKPGLYLYHCSAHAATMTANILVE